ncbi:glycosyltransferase [Vibrio sp. 10N.237.312.C02]|uniref:glycosyltransferase n=3 Tax=Vibrionaceae TaxID=641 RepID=UPI00352C6608
MSYNVGLMFSKCTSLQQWYATGLAYREFDIYKKLIADKSIKELHVFTYGSCDRYYYDKLKKEGVCGDNIVVHPMPKAFDNKVGRRIYQLAMPIIYNKEIKKLDVLKTNQLSSCIPVLISKLLYKKTIYLRTGYSLTYFLERQKKHLQCFFWKNIEKIAVNYADICACASVRDVNEWKILKKNNSRVVWLPNYIDTDKFQYCEYEESRIDRVVYVGRYNDQKNLFSLLEACKGASLGIDLYGHGELESELIDFSKSNGIDAKFNKKLDNNLVAETLTEYKYFALCSHYEGTPKILLEAMAVGSLIVATKVPGISSIIKDQKHAVLANDVSSQSIQNSLIKAKHLNINDAKELAKNANNKIMENYSLKCVSKVEKNNYEDIISK